MGRNPSTPAAHCGDIKPHAERLSRFLKKYGFHSEASRLDSITAGFRRDSVSESRLTLLDRLLFRLARIERIPKNELTTSGEREIESATENAIREARHAKKLARDWEKQIARQVEVIKQFQSRHPNTAPKAKSSKRKRHRRRTVTDRLTQKQSQVATVVCENDGNYSKAAKQLGVDESTVRQHWRAACRKMPELAKTFARGRTARMTRLPRDKRGQTDLPDR